MLLDDISLLGDDPLLIAEEFGDWEDARRRIDLLRIDRTGRLVVIELERTDDGGGRPRAARPWTGANGPRARSCRAGS
jgi:hypothetical protein